MSLIRSVLLHRYPTEGRVWAICSVALLVVGLFLPFYEGKASFGGASSSAIDNSYVVLFGEGASEVPIGVRLYLVCFFCGPCLACFAIPALILGWVLQCVVTILLLRSKVSCPHPASPGAGMLAQGRASGPDVLEQRK